MLSQDVKVTWWEIKKGTTLFHLIMGNSGGINDEMENFIGNATGKPEACQHYSRKHWLYVI